MGFVLLLTVQRAAVRAHHEINGNPVEDFFASLVLYPSVAIQLDHAFDKQGLTTIVPCNNENKTQIGAVIKNENVNCTV